jgi:Cu-processing system permease protein
MSRFANLLLCAGEETTLAVRSRWVQIFALAFGALALAVALSGYVLSGGSGVQDFARTSASLVQLVILLVPLAALFTGILALAPERGAAELLYSQPLARSTVMLGRLLGLFRALLAAEGLGFGAAGFVVFSQAGGEGLAAFFVVAGAAVVLTAIFLAVAALVSTATGRRSRALAVALVVWLASIVLLDLAALGVSTLLRSGHASRVLIGAALLNPVAAVRTGALLLIEGTAAFGPASLALLRLTRGPAGAALLIGLSIVAWIVVPSVLAARRLARLDI